MVRYRQHPVFCEHQNCSGNGKAHPWYAADNGIECIFLISRHLAYFLTLGLNEDEASELHLKYYTQYGLALRGLTRHHDIGIQYYWPFATYNTYGSHSDPLDFDRKCDGSLPLEDMIKPSPALRKLFEDIDRTKGENNSQNHWPSYQCSVARVWALTNAYRPVR